MNYKLYVKIVFYARKYKKYLRTILVALWLSKSLSFRIIKVAKKKMKMFLAYFKRQNPKKNLDVAFILSIIAPVKRHTQ